VNETSHRDIAISFLQRVAAGQVRSAYEEYVASNFRHHNPFFPGDRESLRQAMEESATRNPDRELEVKIVLAEGDLVATCSHIRQEPRSRGAAVVHIFRFAAGKIVEMWDIGQDIPENSPNENGMF